MNKIFNYFLILFLLIFNLYADDGDNNVENVLNQKHKPMIEVSVDIIEISQTNGDVRGFTWNDPLNFEEGLNNSSYFNFANADADGSSKSGSERGNATSFYKIGSIRRPDALIGKLRLLITKNLARLLSNPKLATESGSQASFLVGGEIPVPVASPQGVSIEWKTYGINLQIRPDLIENNKKITAMVQISISDLDNANAVTLDGYKVPALLNRSANSKITVDDGGTIVIAGLKNVRKSLVERKVPILGSIPIIGWFFRQKEAEDKENSMVIFVTFKKTVNKG